MKLPILVHHYLEHLSLDHKKSFVDFVKDHYAKHQIDTDNKHHHHENLPFKTSNCTTAQVLLAFVNPIQLSFPRPNTFQEKASQSYHRDFYSKAFINNIWQPPKIS